MNDEIIISADSGQGRPFVLLHEQGTYADLVAELTPALSAVTRTVVLQSTTITDRNWGELSDALTATLSQLAIKQASFVAFGAAGALVQHLALLDLRAIRTIVFVDASTRPHPSLFARMIDRIERALPLGLPLRSRSRGFDGRAFLQRIRCPVLVICSARASHYQRREASLLMHGLPSAWDSALNADGEAAALTAAVLEFQKLPAKCPQKSADIGAK